MAYLEQKSEPNHSVLFRLSCVALALLASCTPATGSTSSHHLDLTEFSITPSSITESPDSVLRLTIENSGKINHNFSVHSQDDNLLADIDLRPSDVKTIELAVGTDNLTLFCNLPGHAEAGMTATIKIDK